VLHRKWIVRQFAASAKKIATVILPAGVPAPEGFVFRPDQAAWMPRAFN
jgi:hypothetical protein